MPRNVRNFYLNAQVEGNASEVSTGPRGKTDGMSIQLYQRDNGQVTKVVRIECIATFNGDLITCVYIPGQDKIEITTKR